MLSSLFTGLLTFLSALFLGWVVGVFIFLYLFIFFAVLTFVLFILKLIPIVGWIIAIIIYIILFIHLIMAPFKIYSALKSTLEGVGFLNSISYITALLVGIITPYLMVYVYKIYFMVYAYEAFLGKLGLDRDFLSDLVDYVKIISNIIG